MSFQEVSKKPATKRPSCLAKLIYRGGDGFGIYSSTFNRPNEYIQGNWSWSFISWGAAKKGLGFGSVGYGTSAINSLEEEKL